MQALRLYYETEESREGARALREKRAPDFMKYYK
jgi:2-ketocyclohexanecarboxyl-CoA hydrolase